MRSKCKDISEKGALCGAPRKGHRRRPPVSRKRPWTNVTPCRTLRPGGAPRPPGVLTSKGHPHSSYYLLHILASKIIHFSFSIKILPSEWSSRVHRFHDVPIFCNYTQRLCLYRIGKPPSMCFVHKLKGELGNRTSNFDPEYNTRNYV